MEDHRYTKQCYLMLKNLDDEGRRTWATYITELLFSYGFGYAWLSQGVGNENNFIRFFFKTRIKDSYRQLWKSKLENSPKVVHYKFFKTDLYSESYLYINLSFILRKILTNFRCPTHDLMVEKS